MKKTTKYYIFAILIVLIALISYSYISYLNRIKAENFYQFNKTGNIVGKIDNKLTDIVNIQLALNLNGESAINLLKKIANSNSDFSDIAKAYIVNIYIDEGRPELATATGSTPIIYSTMGDIYIIKNDYKNALYSYKTANANTPSLASLLDIKISYVQPKSFL